MGKSGHNWFSNRKAVAYTKALIHDPVGKAALIKQLKSRKTTANQFPYQAAIQDYMKAHSNPMLASEQEKAALAINEHGHLSRAATTRISSKHSTRPEHIEKARI